MVFTGISAISLTSAWFQTDGPLEFFCRSCVSLFLRPSILAALIIGASLLMRIETPFQFFGYPGLAMTCFLAAAAGGFWLVIGIFLKDQQDKKRPARKGGADEPVRGERPVGNQAPCNAGVCGRPCIDHRHANGTPRER